MSALLSPLSLQVSILGSGMAIGAATVCPKCPVVAFAELQSNPVITCIDLEGGGDSKSLPMIQFDGIAKLEIKDMCFSWDGKNLAVITGETDNELVLLEWRSPPEKRVRWRIQLGCPFSHVSVCPTDNDHLCVSGVCADNPARVEGECRRARESSCIQV